MAAPSKEEEGERGREEGLPSPSRARHPGQMKAHWTLRTGGGGCSRAAREHGVLTQGPSASQLQVLPTIQEWGWSPEHCAPCPWNSVPITASTRPSATSNHWLCIPSASHTPDPAHPWPLAVLPPHPGSTALRFLNLWQHQQQPCQRHYNKGSLKSPELFPILWPLSLCEQRGK